MCVCVHEGERESGPGIASKRTRRHLGLLAVGPVPETYVKKIKKLSFSVNQKIEGMYTVLKVKVLSCWKGVLVQNQPRKYGPLASIVTFHCIITTVLRGHDITNDQSVTRGLMS